MLWSLLIYVINNVNIYYNNVPKVSTIFIVVNRILFIVGTTIIYWVLFIIYRLKINNLLLSCYYLLCTIIIYRLKINNLLLGLLLFIIRDYYYLLLGLLLFIVGTIIIYCWDYYYLLSGTTIIICHQGLLLLFVIKDYYYYLSSRIIIIICHQ
jgi:hypothetical protein